MSNFLAGIVVGIILSTIGLKGVAHMVESASPVVDGAVQSIKEKVKDSESAPKLKPLS